MSAVHVSFYPLSEGKEELMQRLHWELCGELYAQAGRTLRLLNKPSKKNGTACLYHVGESLTLTAQGKYAESLEALKPLLKNEDVSLEVKTMSSLHAGFLHLLLENEGVAQKFFTQAEKTVTQREQPFLLYFLGLLLLKKEDPDTALKALLEARRSSEHAVLKAKIALALLSTDSLPVKEELILKTCEEMIEELSSRLPAVNPHAELAVAVQLERIVEVFHPHPKNLGKLLPLALKAGERLFEFGLLDRCLHLCQRLLDMAELYTASQAEHLIDVYTLRGNALSFKKEYTRAKKDFDYALFLTRQCPIQKKIAKARLYRSINLAKQKDWENARKDLEAFLENPDSELASVALREQAFYALAEGRLDEASNLVRKAIDQARTQLQMARSYRLEGMIALKKKDPLRAMHALRISIEKFLSEKNYLEYGITLRFVAEAFALSGDFASAHDYLDEGIELLSHYGFEQELPYFYSLKARLFLVKELFQHAEECGAKELEITSKLKGEMLAYTLLLNARIKRERAELKGAESLLQQALKIFSQQRNFLLKGECLLEQALVFAEERRFSEGLRNCQIALELFEKARHFDGQAKAFFVRGKILNKMRQTGKARQSLTSALRISKNVLKQQTFDLAEVFAEMAEALAMSEEKEKAAEALFSALEIVERMGLENRIQKYLSRLQDISPQSIAQYRLRRLTGSMFSDELSRMTKKVKLARQNMTVLFVDLRGFTQLIERKDHEEVAILLHRFYKICSQASSQFGGQLNKFLGDGALFLFPENTPSDALFALQSAFFIKEQLKRLISGMEEQIDFGITLDRGEALLGTFGFGTRQDYTAIGRCINVASRLQALAEKGEIIISQSVYDRLKDKVSVSQEAEVEVKGITEKVRIFVAEDLVF